MLGGPIVHRLPGAGCSTSTFRSVLVRGSTASPTMRRWKARHRSISPGRGCFRLPWSRPARGPLAAEGIGFLPAAAVVLPLPRGRTSADEPVFPLDLFSRPVMAVASATGALIGGAMISMVTFVPLFVQSVLPGTPTEAGTTITPIAIGWPISSTLAGRLMPGGVPDAHPRGPGAHLLRGVGLSPSSTRRGSMVAAADRCHLRVGLGFANTPLLIAVQSASPGSSAGSPPRAPCSSARSAAPSPWESSEPSWGRRCRRRRSPRRGGQAPRAGALLPPSGAGAQPVRGIAGGDGRDLPGGSCHRVRGIRGKSPVPRDRDRAPGVWHGRSPPVMRLLRCSGCVRANRHYAGGALFVAFARRGPDNAGNEGKHAASEYPGQPLAPRLPPGEDVRPHEPGSRGPQPAGRLPRDASRGGAYVACLEAEGSGDRRGAPRHRGVLPGRAAPASGVRDRGPGRARAGGISPVAGVRTVRTGRGDGPAPPPPLAERPGRAGGRIARSGKQPPRTPRGPGGGTPPEGCACPRPGRRDPSVDPGAERILVRPLLRRRPPPPLRPRLHLDGDFLRGDGGFPAPFPRDGDGRHGDGGVPEVLPPRLPDHRLQERVHGDPLQRRRRRGEIPGSPSSASHGRSA